MQVRNFWIPELREEEAQIKNCSFSRPVPRHVLQTLLAQRTLFDTGGQFNTPLRLGSDADWCVRAREKGSVGGLVRAGLSLPRPHRPDSSSSFGQSRRPP